MSHIAIVGIAVEFPSGLHDTDNLDYESFFDLLLNSEQTYEPIPATRFNTSGLCGTALGQVLPSHGSFLKNIEAFDHLEFGVNAKDAAAMPVGTRKLLELSFLALRDSGIDYRGHNVGCYMSGVQHDEFMLSEQDETAITGSFTIGPCSIANRVSYHLDLRGPSIPVDTACSSTLTATHLAVQALLAGDCSSAVVGGAQLNLRMIEWLQYSSGGIVSPDGRCKPFDASADGFGRAEGVAAIVLKPLAQAMADGDRVRGVILGTGVNSSGSVAPVNAPVDSAQEDAMRRAFQMANRSPRDVSFLELHATGTARGDPTEANWIGRAFKRDGDILIGSVKGNIGHAEIVSFFASLSKVLSVCETGLIPPSVNLSNPNPAIEWDEHRLHVVQRTRRLPSGSRPLIAMTSSGIGGANGHAVIEGPPRSHGVSPEQSFWRPDVKEHSSLLVLGGLSPRSTTVMAQEAQALDDCPYLPDALLTYGRISRSMTWRSWGIMRPGHTTHFSEPALASKIKRPVVFVFSGQGSQHLEMGRGLFKTSRVFQEAVLALDVVFHRATGESLISTYGLFDDITPSKSLDGIWPIAITLPAIAMLQLALFDTLVHLGIKPDYVVGHSAGETAVMYASGASSRKMAMELAIARGRGMSSMETRDGTMAALACAEERAHELIARVEGQGVAESLQIGCFNSSTAVTLSGSSKSIDEAVKLAKVEGIFSTRLRTKVPVHSRMMLECENEYRGLVTSVFDKHVIGTASTAAYSSLTGGRFSDVFTADYFWDNTIGPVRFCQAMESLVSNIGEASFVEIGPHPVLASYIDSIAAAGSLTLAPLRRPGKITDNSNTELSCFLAFAGQLASSGYNSFNFAALAGCGSGLLQKLPRYPFSPRLWPIWLPSATVSRFQQPRNGPLNFPQLRVNVQTHPSLAQHSIKGEPIMPAAGYIEMALEFGVRQLWDVEFISIIGLSASKPIPVDVRSDGQTWTVMSASLEGASRSPIQYDRLHARGCMGDDLDAVERRPPAVNIDELKQHLELVKVPDFYEGLRYFADYGPEYRRIQTIFASSNAAEFLVEVRGMGDDLAGAPPYRLHPAILDAAIHAAVHPMFSFNLDTSLYFLPSKLGRIIFHDKLLDEPMPHVLYSHMRLMDWTPSSRTYNSIIYDDRGVALCTLIGLEIERHGHLAIAPVTERFTLDYQPTGTSIVRTTTQTRTCPSQDSGVVIVLPFAHGEELNVQKELLAYSHSDPLILWFTANQEEHGHAAIGFSRSLRREFPGWKVYLSLFDSVWTVEEHKQLVLDQLLPADIELETLVARDGVVHVPRVTRAAGPSVDHSFKEERPWSFVNSELIHHDCLPPRKGHVLVNVMTMSSGEGDVRAYTGAAGNSRRLVVGITRGPLTNVISAPECAVVDLPTSFDGFKNGPPALAAVTIAMGLSARALQSTLCINEDVVIVTHSDEVLGSTIVALLRHAGYNVRSVPSTVTLPELACLRKLGAAFIFTGYTDLAALSSLKQTLTPEGSLFAWNDHSTGVRATFERQPWAIGDSLRAVLPFLASDDTPREAFTKPIDIVKATLQQSHLTAKHDCKLFSPEKTYLLIGGIGSLGCQVALWMYENGARRIVMTSRSGRLGLFQRQDPTPQQTVLYLESRADLQLSLLAADATDEDAMRSLISCIDGPIAGCMLLCLIMSDKSFLRHTPETYFSVFPPKVAVFQVIQKILHIESLDWLIAFSSVVSLFGNAGQTNYATANAIVDNYLKDYRNAFSLIVPTIIDSLITHDSNPYRLRHLLPWSFTSRALCQIIEDGIKMLSDGPLNCYIPAFNWDMAQTHMGASPMFSHLVSGVAHMEYHQQQTAQRSPTDIVVRLLELRPEDLSLSVPLTSYGLDSLSAARLSVALSPFIHITQMQLLADITMSGILTRIADQEAQVGSTFTPPSKGSTHASTSSPDPEDVMLELVDRYSARFRHISRIIDTDGILETSSNQVVVLTGTTGAVGCAALAKLARSPQVSKIYALNRSSETGLSLEQRQDAAFITQGWQIDQVHMQKIRFIEAVLHRPNLDLPREVYDEIVRSATHFVHSAYPVNFNMNLTAFESSIAGLENLLICALSSPQKQMPHFIFLSSFATLINTGHTMHAAEAPLPDPRIAVGNGYGESKWVCETILIRAAQTAQDLPYTIVRPGQISGSPNGAWDVGHWAPAIIVASPIVQALPRVKGFTSWIPVAEVADVLAAIIRRRQVPSVVHIARPNPVKWVDLVQHAASEFNLPLVSWEEWLRALDRTMADESLDQRDQRRLEPAFRLRSFFHDQAHLISSRSDTNECEAFALPRLDTTSLQSLTPAIESAESLGQKDVKSWIDYWRRIDMV